MDQVPTKGQLIKDIESAYDNFIDALQVFSTDKMNRVPFVNSWTPGQVAHHIIKGTSDIPDAHTKPAGRPFDEKVAALEKLFLDFSIKMQSPEFVQPGKGPFDKDRLIEKLHAIKLKHQHTIANKDISEICLDFELPHTGPLTRYEWFRFFIAHCKRHSRQLENMKQFL